MALRRTVFKPLIDNMGYKVAPPPKIVFIVGETYTECPACRYPFVPFCVRSGASRIGRVYPPTGETVMPCCGVPTSVEGFPRPTFVNWSETWRAGT